MANYFEQFQDEAPKNYFAQFQDEAPAQDGALKRGWNSMTQNVGITKSLALGDHDEAAAKIAEAARYRQANPGSKEGHDLAEAWGREKGVLNSFGNVFGEMRKDWREAPSVLEAIRATGRNVGAMGAGVVEQLPNAVPSLGLMLAGGAAGSVVPGAGTAVGAFTGAAAGNTLIEGGAMVMEALQEAGIDPRDTAAVKAWLEKNGNDTLLKAGVKGSIIGAVDTLTAGAGGKILSAPVKAATNRALKDMGVDVANKAAVKAAMETPEFAARIAGDATLAASQSGIRNAARNATVAALEPAGEFVGEYLGQGVATGDYDAKNATLEALSSVGQSGMTFAGQKAYSAAKYPFRAERKPETSTDNAIDASEVLGAVEPDASYQIPLKDESRVVADEAREFPVADQANPAPQDAPEVPTPESALLSPKSLTDLDRVGQIEERMREIGPLADAGDVEADAEWNELRAQREAITANWPNAVPGARTSFSTEAGVHLDGQYALMEADALMTSHDESLHRVKEFPQELQPRKRERHASEMQVQQMVQKLDPARLGESADVATGAPIVGADGLVESGNARTIALKRAYSGYQMKANDYKDFIKDNAQRFGLDPSVVDAMEKPVLVRVRQTPVDRAEFARQANQETVARAYWTPPKPKKEKLFASAAQAQEIVTDLDLGQTHEVVRVGRGFVVRRKTAPAGQGSQNGVGDKTSGAAADRDLAQGAPSQTASPENGSAPDSAVETGTPASIRGESESSEEARSPHPPAGVDESVAQPKGEVNGKSASPPQSAQQHYVEARRDADSVNYEQKGDANEQRAGRKSGDASRQGDSGRGGAFASAVPRGLPAREDADSLRLVSRIREDLDRRGVGGVFDARTVQQARLPDALAGALAAFEQATGSRVVIFRNLTPEVEDFNGVNFRDGVVYINENSDNPVLSTAAHEWLHNLRRTHPNLYRALAEEVGRQGRLPEYQQRLRRDGDPRWKKGDVVVEELTAASVADALTDPVFLERLAKRNQGGFRKMARLFIDFLNTLAGKWKDQGSNRYLRDVEAFRDKLEAVLDLYQNAGQGGKVSSPMFRRAWHGTPYRGIEDTGFSLDKIGTGEGAQAYGWGMYFASQKEVAEMYRRQLSDSEDIVRFPFGDAEVYVHTNNGWMAEEHGWPLDGADEVAAEILLQEEVEEVRQRVEEAAKGGEDTVYISDRDVALDEAQEALKLIDDGAIEHDVRRGQLYQAEVPEDGDLLDWDKPLSGQPQRVQKIIRENGLPLYDERHYDAMLWGDGSWRIYRIDPLTRKAEQVAKLDGEDARTPQEAIGVSGVAIDNGRFLYEKLTREKGSPRAASEYLNMLGIPGLRYLDGNSRADGEGSHNYVIWDEALLTPEAAQIKPMYSRKVRNDLDEQDMYLGHNITESGLRHALDLGGLAAPSLAVARTSTGGMEEFGEITLLADKGLIGRADAPLFDADIYSPRQPRGWLRINMDKWRAFNDQLDEAPEIGPRPASSDVEQDGAEALLYNPRVQWLFMRQNGIAIPSHRKVAPPAIRRLVNVARKYGQTNAQQMENSSEFVQAATRAALSDVAAIGRDDAVLAEDVRRDLFNDDGTLDRSALSGYAQEVEDYVQRGGIDVSATMDTLRKKLDNKALKSRFGAWVADRIGEMTEGRFLGKGVMAKPYTLDNVVKEMARKLRGGEGFSYGVGNIRASLSARIKNIPEAQRRREKIIPNTEFQKIAEESRGRLISLLEEIKPYYRSDANRYSYYDEATAALAEGEKGLREAFRLEGEVRRKVSAFYDYLRSLPTSYFEMKVRRAMPLEEFKAAVVPEGTSPDVVQALRERGLRVETYAPGARAKAIEKIARGQDIMFSRREKTKAAYERRIDELFAGAKANPEGVKVLDRSDMLDMLGVGDKPLKLAEGKVVAGQSNHPKMTAEVWKKIPEWVENPAMVFDSDTVDGRLVFVAPEKIGDNDVRIVIEPKGNGLEAHVLVNAYDTKTGATPYSRWARDRLLRYADKKNASRIDERFGLQLPDILRNPAFMPDAQIHGMGRGNKKASRRTKILTENNLAGYRKNRAPMFSRNGKRSQASMSQKERRRFAAALRSAFSYRSRTADEIINTKAFGSVAPLDAIAKAPFKAIPIHRVTSKLYDGAGFLLDRFTPEVIKAGLVSDYGVPEAVLDARAEMEGRQRKLVHETGTLLERLATLTRAESRVAYEWMNNDNPQAADYFEKQLPEESVKTLKEAREMIDRLSKEAIRLGQLTQEAYERNKFAYLRRSYAKYTAELTAGEAARAKRATAILGDQYKGRGMTDAVAQSSLKKASPQWWARNANKELKGERFLRLERREDGRLREIAYVPAREAVPSQYRGWAEAGTWEVRGSQGNRLVLWRDFTKQEREKLGEIDEVRFAIAKTMHAMIHDIETGRYLEWLSNNYAKGEGDTVDGRIVEASESLRAVFKPGDWVQVPDTKIPGTQVKKFGALAGRYIPGPIWNDVRQTVSFKNAPLGETFASVMRFWKMSKTALSPAVHMNNVMANFVMADWHDVTAAHVLKAVKLMASKDAASQEVWERYAQSGGTVGSFAVTEMQKEQLRPLLESLEKELGRAGETAGQIGVFAAVQHVMHLRFPEAFGALSGSGAGHTTKKAARAMLDLYEAEDQVFRLAAWLKAKEDGASDAQAGKAARKSFLDYRINAPWVQMMRGTLFPFISFTYRAAPMLLETAAKKPWKLLKLGLVAGALNAFGYALSGGDEDEERRLLPEEKAGTIFGLVPKLIRMPWNDEHGSPVFLDIRRWVPAGDITDTGATNAAFPILPSMQPGGPLALVFELALNKTQFTGKPITLETDTATEKAQKVADHLYKAFAPNIPILPGTYSFTSIMNAGKGKTDAFGRERSVSQAVISSVGIKLGSYPADVARQNIMLDARLKGMEIQKNIAAINREFARKAISADERLKQIDAQNRKRLQVHEEVRKKLGRQ